MTGKCKFNRRSGKWRKTTYWFQHRG